MSESEALKGVVKWFNDAKGFGFIEHANGQDVFVHYSVIEDDGFKTLKDGEEVSYEIQEGPKGLHAVKVCRTTKATEADVDSNEASDSSSVANSVTESTDTVDSDDVTH